MSVLDDFFGDGNEAKTPVCSYCGRKDGDLVVSVRDANGPTHWHHKSCKAEAEAEAQAKAEQRKRDNEWFMNHPSA